MKTIHVILLMLAMISINSLPIPVRGESDPKKTDTSLLDGWQQYYCRKHKLHMDDINVKLGLFAGAEREFGLSLTFDTDIQRIECCKACDEEFNWCNFDEENTNC